MYTPVNASFTIKLGVKGFKVYMHVFVMEVPQEGHNHDEQSSRDNERRKDEE